MKNIYDYDFNSSCNNRRLAAVGSKKLILNIYIKIYIIIVILIFYYIILLFYFYVKAYIY